MSYGDLTNSLLLRARMELISGDLYAAFDSLWRRPGLAQLYPSFLILLHQIMRASVPLMEAAQRRALELAGSDAVCVDLARYYETHIEEERGHDLGTLDDLAAAGFPRAAVLSRTPLPDVASLVGAQYYWIHHHHPAGLLGYIAVLEGSPPSGPHIDRLQKLTGLPAEAFRTYRLHGCLDPHHRDHLDRAMDELPLTRNHVGMIGMSAAHTARLLAECVRNLEPIARPRHAAAPVHTHGG